MELVVEFIKNIFETRDFMPRWVCGNWSDLHGWIYILSNIAIWAAYFTIPLLLFHFIQRRKGFQFKSVFVWFILFIFFCGSTHFIDAVIFWIPLYRFNALFLAITAIISWITVFVLSNYLPMALDYKSPEQLQHIIDEQTKELAIAYQKLTESEKQFKALVNNNPDVITRIGKDLKYKYINDAILKMRKLKIEDIIGMSVDEISKNNDPENNIVDQLIKNVEMVFSSGQSQTYEFTTHTNSSRKAYFSINIIPLRNEENDEIDDVLTVTKDITLQKLNEIALEKNIENLEMLAQKLENKRRILEDFTYIVSHNLRSPVANLSSLLHLINDADNSQMRDMLIEKVSVAFEKLSTTVSDLTNVVQIRQNTNIKREMLRFEDIMKNHLTNLETQIKEAEADISYDFNKCEIIEYPKIYLESILLNLLTNSLKYKSPNRKPKIIFTSTNNDGIIKLVCEDNGLGIDLKKHEHKLFGLNKTFHEHPDSKGVGLFITKNQIETMGGSISVESVVDVGTKFIIRFNSYADISEA